tara:strand:- start:1139 stop:3634 length:2496 start_codon:yes stop_codon:yes gene_type:complete
MVILCDKPFEDDSNYSLYFERFSKFKLSDFQKWAIKAIVDGDNIMITAHTGSGKTLPAEFAIQYFVEQGKKVIYTAPIKALSNTKLCDLRNKYPHISFGIITGDITDNPEADVLIMTTEVLPNTLINKNIINNSEVKIPLSFEMDFESELAAVVFDEVHYINDRERGGVWEQAILMLPPHVQLIMLSATIDKPETFANWVETEKCAQAIKACCPPKQVYLAPTNHRVVPLTHYLWLTTYRNTMKAVKGTEFEVTIPKLSDKPVVLKDEKGVFSDKNFHSVAAITKYLHKNRIFIKRQHVLDGLIRYLKANNGLPAICFVFSRKHVEQAANEMSFSLYDADSTIPSTIEQECRKILTSKLPNFKEYLQLPEYVNLLKLLKKGIGIHHAGVLAVFREMVEMLFERKIIKLLFATETLAVGINFSTTSVIYTGVSKFDGQSMRMLAPHEYTQISGRAGRRGIDKVGKVWLCANLINLSSVTDFQHMLTGPPQTLSSKFKISFGLGLNIFASNQESLNEFANRSLMTKDINNEILNCDNIILELQNKLETQKQSTSILHTKKEVIEEYMSKKQQLDKLKNKKRKAVQREIQFIEENNKFLKQDLLVYQEQSNLEKQISETLRYKNTAQKYMSNGVQRTISLMQNAEFINDNQITLMGIIAGQFQEIHPLVMAKVMVETNYFEDLSSGELAGLFACFINISISDDLKLNFPTTTSKTLNLISSRINTLMNEYYDMELKFDVDSGSNYERSFDLQQHVINWCKAIDENSCKEILQDVKKDYQIFLGEFIKGLLKINNIAAEVERAAETVQQLALIEKLRAIPAITLKYVATNQSLYV